MSDQFVAEIRIFPFNFPPKGWAFCNGQLLPLSQNTALFSLLGTTYGGDGKSTFALPDMLDSVPMQPGQGQGLSLRDLGEISGSQTVTLLNSEIPIHTHIMQVSSQDASTASPTAAYPAKGLWDAGTGGGLAGTYVAANAGPQQMMNPQQLAPTGGSLPHNNMQPYLALNFCIALQGIFPQRP
ncbi:MAG: phage tail protein [Caulobacteraceae bacterium]|nr:tail fiber protein [Caulobacter sp.]RYF93448.1 MAG: phage tail protein [Caulobacteraceae bacterium]